MSNHRIPISASSRFFLKAPDRPFSFHDSLTHLKNAGFDGVDFSLEFLPYMGFNEEQLKAYCYDLRNHAEKIGLAVTFGHLPFSGTQKAKSKDKAAMKQKLHEDILVCIRAAGYLGLKRAVLHPVGDKKEPRSEEANERGFLGNLEQDGRWRPWAEEAGVVLAIESVRDPLHAEGCHRYAATADEVLRIAKATGNEVCWDFGHAHTSGLKQSDELRKLEGYLTVTHVNDNIGGDDLHLFPYFGTIDWTDAMQGLHDIGFKDFFNYECKTFRLPHDLHDEIAAYAIKLAESLTAMI